MKKKQTGYTRASINSLACNVLSVVAVLLFTNTTALASSDCSFQYLSPGYWGGKDFIAAEQVTSVDRRLNTSLEVRYEHHKIAGCKTRLRGYDGKLVGKTLRVKPGDTINIKLQNQLPKDDTPLPDDPNIPHNFNVTNFHSHGLHVSPAGNSDNVLIAVDPGQQWDVEINVPDDHPTGTFWYHAHLHGSTALQVSSGMGGALIVENDKDPHSLDSITEIKRAKEHIMLLQQISYDEKGEIENYDIVSGSGWQTSQRLPTINGQIMPEIVMRPGEVQRWRLIHGGIGETFTVAIVDTDISPEQPGAPWPLNEIAVDGLSLGYMAAWQQVALEPGYRSDILVKAPQLPKGVKTKEFYMMDLGSDAEKSLHGLVENQQVLAKVVVRGKPTKMALPCKPNVPCKKLAKTRPHKDIADSELLPEREKIVFNIARRECPTPGQPCKPCADDNQPDCKERYMINNIPFALNNVRELVLNTASEWELNSENFNHPFHIHVNPFQVERLNPLGKKETVWRDTLLVREKTPVTIRSRYQRYIGKFVLHCHILDHEDRGMMQVVEVVAPSSSAHDH